MATKTYADDQAPINRSNRVAAVTPAELDELKSRPGNSCAEVAERLGAHLRRHGREKIGPCVICSKDLQSKTATRWQTKGEGWVCATCEDGGDCIWLVQKALNLDFKAAVEWLGEAGRGRPRRSWPRRSSGRFLRPFPPA
jgi:hypothetical protein